MAVKKTTAAASEAKETVKATATTAKPAEAKTVEVKATEAKAETAKPAPAKKTATKTTKAAAPAKKASAKKAEEPKVTMVIEYGVKQVLTEEIIENVKAKYLAEGGKEEIKTIEVFLKPEQSKAYYIINGNATEEMDVFFC